MKVPSAILLSVALYAQTSTGSGVQEMCDQFQGELVDIPISSNMAGERDFVGLSHTFCVASFGASDNRTVFMDASADQSLTRPSIASTLYKTIPFVNYRAVMKDRTVGSTPVAAALCSKLGGSQVSDYNLDYGFINKDGFNVLCAFADGSFIDSWALYYDSISPAEKDQASVYKAMRDQIPNEMLWPRFGLLVDEDFFIKPTEVRTCKQDSDCVGFKNPCQALKGKPARVTCDLEQNICTAEKREVKCTTDADCLFESLSRSYAEDGLGYCIPQVCTGMDGQRLCEDAH